jgi:hypothetical protein
MEQYFSWTPTIHLLGCALPSGRPEKTSTHQHTMQDGWCENTFPLANDILFWWHIYKSPKESPPRFLLYIRTLHSLQKEKKIKEQIKV